MIAVFMTVALWGAEPENQASAALPAFRVETEVFTGGQLTTASRNVTLFDDQLVVDFNPDDAKTIMVYDLKGGNAIRLNETKRERSVVAFAVLNSLVAELRRGLTEAQSAQFGVDVVPRQLADGTWSASAPAAVYEVTCQPEPVAEAAKRFAMFANNAVRMNVYDGINAPPFMRIRLNEAFEHLSLLPATVTIANKQVTSKHRLSTEFSEAERVKIAEARRNLRQFAEVPWKQ